MADYPITIHRLSAENGGGFAAVVEDLPGCVSDGETVESAVRNVQGAILEWISTAESQGRPIPLPTQRKAFA